MSSEEFNAARREQDERREARFQATVTRDLLSVACPLLGCEAPKGQPCTSNRAQGTIREPHEARAQSWAQQGAAQSRRDQREIPTERQVTVDAEELALVLRTLNGFAEDGARLTREIIVAIDRLGDALGIANQTGAWLDKEHP